MHVPRGPARGCASHHSSIVQVHGSGERIRTTDLRVMSPTSYHCSTPRRSERRGRLQNQTDRRRRCALRRSIRVKMNRSGDRMGSIKILPARSRERPGSEPSAISNAQLHVLPRFHLRPINLVIFQGPYPVDPVGSLIFRRASHLDAFSAYPCRTSATRRCAWRHNRYTGGPSIPVLSY